MNPSAILKLMSAKAAFTKNHPKFSAFCKAALSRPIEPGTIIEISLQRPGEEPMMANIKVQQEDLDLLEELAEMAWKTRLINSEVSSMQQTLLDKHYLRKHGPGAYYGQK